MPLKRSREFRALRGRLAGEPPHPLYDSWLDDEFHFFVFVLASSSDGDRPDQRTSFAVFAMHPDSQEPVSAVTVEPIEDGTEAEITDLQPPGGSHLAPYPLQQQLDSPEPPGDAQSAVAQTSS